MGRPLDEEILSRFERALFSVAPAYEEHLRPGLSRAQIAQEMERMPGRLPEELVLWWEWRNGVPELEPGLRPGNLPIVFFGGEIRLFVPLEECVQSYRSQWARIVEFDEYYIAPPVTWFPIDVWFAVDLPKKSLPSLPVLLTDSWSDAYGEEQAASLGELILAFAEALEGGSIFLGPAETGWDCDPEELPPILKRNQLV